MGTLSRICVSCYITVVAVMVSLVSSDQASFSCEDKITGGYYADPTDCSQYYRCVYGTAYKSKCSPGYLFNPVYSYCDYESNVYCVIGATPAPPVSCDGQLEGTYLADPDDCQFYYRCLYGEARRGRCADGLRWSVTYQYCDHATNVVCTSKQTTPTSETTTPSGQDSGISCVNKVTGGFYRDPSDCSKYYMCLYGVVQPMQCSSGYLFNPVYAYCDFAYNVYCVTGPTPAPPVSCAGQLEGTYLADPNDCQFYYRCMYGEARRGRCADGLRWSVTYQYCDHAANVPCDAPEGGGTTVRATPTTTTLTSSTTTATTATTKKPSTNTATTAASTTKRTTASATTATTTKTTTTSTTTTESTPSTSKRKVVCYFTNWAQYRRGLGTYHTADLDPNLCTDVIYAFAAIDVNNNGLSTIEYNDEQLYREIVDMKSVNSNLKFHLAIGGYSAGTWPFETLTSSNSRMQTFATNSAAFLRTHGFDGLDLDWEFPGASFKTKFTTLCQILHDYFVQEATARGLKKLELSAAVSAYKVQIENSYEPTLIHQYLDHIAVMSYDFNGPWSPAIGHNSPLYVREEDKADPTASLLSQNASMYWWHQLGVPKDKLVMGLASYGRTFRMTSPTAHAPGSPYLGAGDMGPYSATGGFLAYYEVCELLSGGGWTRVWMADSQVPYAYGQRNGHWEWVGYDDLESIKVKAKYIKDNGYAGAMFWTLDFDDFKHNVCGQGLYPLIGGTKAGLE